MEFLNEWWGRNEDITVSEIAARAAVMFVVALVLIRLSGMRPFGKENVYDTIVAFLIGGILSRGVVGATPFFSTLAAAITLIVLHKIIVKLSILNKAWERLVKGKVLVLYRGGKFFFENMKQANISEDDIYEELRLERHIDTLEKVKEVYMEKTGEISFVMKAD